MKSIKIALAVAVFALVAGPAALAAGKPEGSPPHGKGGGHGPEYKPAEPTPGPKAGLPAKAKAYGRYCKGESKQHEAGKKGTPFSLCVTAMAKAANDESMPPGQACKGESKQHEAGKKGTPFSLCVNGVAKLRKDRTH